MNRDVALDRSVLSNIRNKGQIGLRGGFADGFITISDLDTHCNHMVTRNGFFL